MRFQIILDNTSHSYYPGQVVSGKVLLDCEEDVTILGLQIKCIGGAEAGFDDEAVSAFFYGKYMVSENYVNCILHLAVEGGPYFPFSFHLPMQIPASFLLLGRKCNVQYNLIATVQRSERLDSEIKIPIKVLGYYDLNYFPGLLNPVKIHEEKCLGLLFLKSGPFGFFLSLNKTGFIPGEFVEFEAEIYNKSSKPVPKSSIELVQLITRLGREYTYRRIKNQVITNREVSIVKIEGPGVSVESSLCWRGDREFQIPSLPPTDLGGFCGIIKVKYFIEMKLQAPDRIWEDVIGKIPITIGTIPNPLQTNVSQPQQEQNSGAVGMNQWQPQQQLQLEYPPLAMSAPPALDLPPSYSSISK